MNKIFLLMNHKLNSQSMSWYRWPKWSKFVTQLHIFARLEQVGTSWKVTSHMARLTEKQLRKKVTGRITSNPNMSLPEKSVRIYWPAPFSVQSLCQVQTKRLWTEIRMWFFSFRRNVCPEFGYRFGLFVGRTSNLVSPVWRTFEIR